MKGSYNIASPISVFQLSKLEDTGRQRRDHWLSQELG